MAAPPGRAVNRTQLLALPQLPGSRACPCGGRLGWSHREYLGGGQTLAVYLCANCGLAYRGGSGAAPDAAGRRSRKPLPSGGSPENPVLDPETAERLRRLLGPG